MDSIDDISIFVLRDYWISRTRCNAVCAGFQCGDSLCLDRAPWIGSSVFVPTVGAFEWNCVAAIWDRSVVSSFHTPLVPTSVCFSRMTSGADGAGGKVLFA